MLERQREGIRKAVEAGKYRGRAPTARRTPPPSRSSVTPASDLPRSLVVCRYPEHQCIGSSEHSWQYNSARSNELREIVRFRSSHHLPKSGSISLLSAHVGRCAVFPGVQIADMVHSPSYRGLGWFADLPACPASPRRRHSTDETGGVPSAALSISAFCVLGRPNVTALWRVLLLPWIGQWILAGIRSCGQAPRLSRKRACHIHDDASVQQGQVDNPGATSAPVHLTSCRGTTARNMRDNAPPNERRVRQTAQRAGPAWANTAKCCEQ